MKLRVIIPAVLLIAAFLLPASIAAGPKEGIMTEFRATEEAIRNAQKTPEARQKTLEDNLLRAVRLAISRRFHTEKKDFLMDLNTETMFYENPTSEKVYYVKYKNFIVRFDYSRDPELYIQAPTYEKFLIVGGEGAAHSDKPPTEGGGQ
ncbi:MAG: hypothetical protein NXI24_13780 [bacterium]|nr:hypothetical protein [bacterium]